MSDHYDLFLSVELRPGLPDDVMREIRWHLGYDEETPAPFQGLTDDGWFYEEPIPFFGGPEQSHAFDGVDVAELLPATNRHYRDGGLRWLLTVRQSVHEDELGWVLQLTEWIASNSTATGWIGYLRHNQEPAPDLMHYVDGRLEFGPAGRTRPYADL